MDSIKAGEKMIKKSIVVFFLFNMIFSQDPLERERNLFYRNVDLYKKSDYTKAEQNFQIIVDRLPNSIFFTSNYLMLTKTKYKLGYYAESSELAQNFINRFPHSKYRCEIINTLGNCYYQQNKYEKAACLWTSAIESALNWKQIEQVRPKLEGILKFKLSAREAKSLRQEFSGSDGNVLLTIIAAEQYIELGEFSIAKELLSETIATHQNSRFISEAENLKIKLEKDQSGKNHFALLLPLSGVYSDIGNEIKEGVELGIQEYNLKSTTKIDLVVMDYKHDLFTAVTKLRYLARDKSLLAVLGPIDNLSAISCAAIADYEKLPVISPTATRDQLTQIGDYFIQLSIPLDIQAEAIARYALDSLKLMRFATLAPIDNEGHYSTLVDKFSEIVEGYGAKIVASEWYYPEEQDYSKQLMRIKRSGLKCAFIDSVSQTDSLITADHLDSLYRLKIKNDQEYMAENNIKLDSADIPLTSIDGLFVPIYNEDLQTLVSHIAQKNIQTYLLGNSDWDDPEQLKKLRRFLGGLIYVKDGYLDENSSSYRKFRNDFRTALKKTPTTYHLIGYDAIGYLLKILGNISQDMTRSKYFERLQEIRLYDGIYRDIRLNSDGANTAVKLLKYQYGQVVLLN
jgi:ABC-type branched-subunit amino acid transport system substrate-binding protein